MFKKDQNRRLENILFPKTRDVSNSLFEQIFEWDDGVEGFPDPGEDAVVPFRDVFANLLSHGRHSLLVLLLQVIDLLLHAYPALCFDPVNFCPLLGLGLQPLLLLDPLQFGFGLLVHLVSVAASAVDLDRIVDKSK